MSVSEGRLWEVGLPSHKGMCICNLDTAKLTSTQTVTIYTFTGNVEEWSLCYHTANSLLSNFCNFANLGCEKMEFQCNSFCISPILRVLSFHMFKKQLLSLFILFVFFMGCWSFFLMSRRSYIEHRLSFCLWKELQIWGYEIYFYYFKEVCAS